MPRRPTFLLLALLGACDPPTSPPVPVKVEAPGLSIRSTELQHGESVKVRLFTLTGRRCKSIQARLLHITSTGVRKVSEINLSQLEASFVGDLSLLSQNGKPFGQKDQTFFSLAHSIKAGTATSTLSDLRLVEGPTNQHVVTSSSYSPGEEHVLLARCFMQGTEGSFGSGNVGELQKQAAELKSDILAITLRWEAD